MLIYSTQSELIRIASILRNVLRLPIVQDSIPGQIMENVLCFVKDAEQLRTYDYIDILDRSQKLGWSLKSTKEDTPVTWKRAKIPNQANLIDKSRMSQSVISLRESIERENNLQDLGDAIIDFCNSHVEQSFIRYDLREIGYSRIILRNDNTIFYFEKSLCDENNMEIFNKADFTWKWSPQREMKLKEQLPALHGFNKHTGDRWWAWHGLGENQLHFTGEKHWWPSHDANHTFTFSFPRDDEKFSWDELVDLLK